jgi:DNA-binding transcriptional regulator YdaS (Cro superfamily)
MDRFRSFLDQQPTGYKAQLARAIGRHPSYFSRQLAGDRAFTENDCIEIEKYTAGQVRCEDIKPGVDWAYLRQTHASAYAKSEGRPSASAEPAPGFAQFEARTSRSLPAEQVPPRTRVSESAATVVTERSTGLAALAARPAGDEGAK